MVDSDSEVRAAIRRFLLMGLISVIVVATPATLWIRAVSEKYTVDSAYNVTQRLADFAIAPMITEDLRAGDRGSLERLNDRLEGWLDHGAVEEILVWDDSGRVVYSNVSSHVGELSTSTVPTHKLLRGSNNTMEVPAESEAVHENHNDAGDLVGVLVGVSASDGRPLIVEAYYDADLVSRHHAGILLSILPPVILALLTLQLAQLIPAVRLARRIQGHRLAQQSLIQRSLDASNIERKRIAQHLHDDVIQGLSGLAYALESQEKHGPPAQRPVFKEARTLLQDNVTRLREMTSSLYPSDLKELGLNKALMLLGGPLVAKSIDVRMELQDTPVDSVQAALLYRFAREAMTNILKHSQADLVRITLRSNEEFHFLRIQDDGVGFNPEAGTPAGHLGMTIMRDSISDTGGSLDISSRIGQGTTLTATLPVSPSGVGD
ncbi:sensor histidine kinase [Paeniglutamicibacter cryotolerans]|uniref:Oxygen sensor histidine kinase NreB n=1 Tax=Paeniglutamicibacter cryotolerans TaxID=670079 RepID=A0A839QT45_9MICC|nr:sensor histidine kinase [Paeniglutamicibacter cryotolerans]MBB2995211.1 signal transduction histidine kinase [Paeniglutamicibacter cryotolerans]